MYRNLQWLQVAFYSRRAQSHLFTSAALLVASSTSRCDLTILFTMRSAILIEVNLSVERIWSVGKAHRSVKSSSRYCCAMVGSNRRTGAFCRTNHRLQQHMPNSIATDHLNLQQSTPLDPTPHSLAPSHMQGSSPSSTQPFTPHRSIRVSPCNRDKAENI